MKLFLKALLLITLILAFGLLFLLNAVAWIELLRWLRRIPSGTGLVVIVVVSVGLGVGGAIYLWQRWTQKRIKAWPFLLAGMVLLAVGVAGVSWQEQLLLAMGEALIVSEGPQRTDAIWILGSTDERYVYGADLYEQGYALQMILSVGIKRAPMMLRSDTIHTNADVIRAYFRARGIPDAAVTFIEAYTTYDEALLARAFLEDNRIGRLLVVSSPEHMRRVSMTFRHVIGDRAELIFSGVPHAMSEFQHRWWRDRYSLGRAIYEFVSIPYYVLVYLWREPQAFPVLPERQIYAE